MLNDDITPSIYLHKPFVPVTQSKFDFNATSYTPIKQSTLKRSPSPFQTKTLERYQRQRRAPLMGNTPIPSALQDYPGLEPLRLPQLNPGAHYDPSVRLAPLTQTTPLTPLASGLTFEQQLAKENQHLQLCNSTQHHHISGQEQVLLTKEHNISSLCSQTQQQMSQIQTLDSDNHLKEGQIGELAEAAGRKALCISQMEQHSREQKATLSDLDLANNRQRHNLEQLTHRNEHKNRMLQDLHQSALQIAQACQEIN